MSFEHPYQAYVEGSVIGGNPLGLVVALYEGTIAAVRSAKECLAAGDTWGRSKATSKGVELLTELLVSLDHREGGEISANLQRLYSYLQCRLLDAHAAKSLQPLDEAERLLTTMLEGWRGAAEKMVLAMPQQAPLYGAEISEDSAPLYGNFSGNFGEEFEPAGVSALF